MLCDFFPFFLLGWLVSKEASKETRKQGSDKEARKQGSNWDWDRRLKGQGKVA